MGRERDSRRRTRGALKKNDEMEWVETSDDRRRRCTGTDRHAGVGDTPRSALDSASLTARLFYADVIMKNTSATHVPASSESDIAARRLAAKPQTSRAVPYTVNRPVERRV